MEGVAGLGLISQKKPGGLRVSQDQGAVGRPFERGPVLAVPEILLRAPQAIEALDDQFLQGSQGGGRVGEPVLAILPSEGRGHDVRPQDPVEGLRRALLVAGQVRQPGQPGRGAFMELARFRAQSLKADRLLAVVPAPAPLTIQQFGEPFPTADHPGAALGGLDELSGGGDRVGLKLGRQSSDFLGASLVPFRLGGSDLLGERGGVVAMAAVGQQGGPDALRDEVFGGRADRAVVVDPFVFATSDFGLVLPWQGDGRGPEPVLQGVAARLAFPLRRFRAGRFPGVLLIDLASAFRGSWHDSGSANGLSSIGAAGAPLHQGRSVRRPASSRDSRTRSATGQGTGEDWEFPLSIEVSVMKGDQFLLI